MRRHQLTVRLLVGAVGVVFILLSVLFTSGTLPAVGLLSVGTSLLASVLVTSLNSLLGADVLTTVREQLGLHNSTTAFGLTKVQLMHDDETIFNEITRAHCVDGMFTTGRSFVERHGHKMAEALGSRDCTIRILVMHPDCAFMRDPIMTQALAPGVDFDSEIRAVLNQLRILVERVRAALPRNSSIEVRGFRCAPTGSVVILNRETARYTSYLPWLNSSEVPVFDAAGNGGLLTSYVDLFERVWGQSERLDRWELPRGGVTVAGN